MPAQTYKLIIRLNSALRSPLHSDTIFGHLMWALAFSEEPDQVQSVLREFGTNPPFLISSGFPHGMLPRPVLRPLSRDEKRALAGDYQVSIVEMEEQLKLAGKVRYIDAKNLIVIASDLSAITLARHLLQKYEHSLSQSEAMRKDVTIMKTAVNRIEGTAQEGQLYDVSESFFSEEMRFDIWVKFFDEGHIDKVKKWFSLVELQGYGADVSSGAGEFKIISFQQDQGLDESAIAAPNSFMSLSNFTPLGSDPTIGTYNHVVKRGKLGGTWSTVSVDGKSSPNVWKHPLIMFAPGSVFRLPEGGGLKAYYGRIANNIHPSNPDIVQYALGFPFAVKLTEQDRG